MCWSHGVGVYRCLVSGGLSVTLPGQFFFGGVLVPYPFVSQPTFSPLTHFFQFKERCGFELVAVGRLCRDGFLTCGLLATWACIKTLPERFSRLLKFFPACQSGSQIDECVISVEAEDWSIEFECWLGWIVSSRLVLHPATVPNHSSRPL